MAGSHVEEGGSKFGVRTLVLLHGVGRTSLVMPFLALRDDSSG